MTLAVGCAQNGTDHEQNICVWYSQTWGTKLSLHDEYEGHCKVTCRSCTNLSVSTSSGHKWNSIHATKTRKRRGMVCCVIG